MVSKPCIELDGIGNLVGSERPTHRLVADFDTVGSGRENELLRRVPRQKQVLIIESSPNGGAAESDGTPTFDDQTSKSTSHGGIRRLVVVRESPALGPPGRLQARAGL